MNATRSFPSRASAPSAARHARAKLAAATARKTNGALN
jgi:hypothetical protein